MKTRFTLAFAAAAFSAAAFSAATATGQGAEQSSGPFAGSYAALSVTHNDPTGLDGENVLLKDEGFSLATPDAWDNPFANPTRPDFSKDKVLYDLSRIGCGVPTVPLDLDAFSGGLDVILATHGGIVQVGGDSWGGIVFSVTPETQGSTAPEGTAIRDEVAGPGGASADLFTYILDGTSAVPPELVGVTMRSQDATEMGLFNGNANSDIDGLDLSIIAHRLDSLVQPFLPAPSNFYFSVSSASVPDVPADWWNGSTPSGATVFICTWTAGSWSCPRPAWTYSRFRLAPEDDLVALAVDEAREFLLFSSDDPDQDPLMFLDFGTASSEPTSYDYFEGGEKTPVSEKIGLQRTEIINAVCTLDPGLLDAGSCTASLHSVMFCQPQTFTWPVLNYNLASSGFRSVVGTTPVWRTYMIGWPPSGPGGLAFILDPITFTAFLAFPRTTAPIFGGGPEQFTLNLTGAPRGICVGLGWFAMGIPPGLPNFVAAHSLRLTLP